MLAPGFIDVHTHVESSGSREGLKNLPGAENYLLDGVTTIVTGNCGGSEIDVGAWGSDLSDLGINVATLVGHNSIRRAVVGLDDRAPTVEEMRQMQALVDKAMQDGAVGFSTGLLYVPGTYATTEEVISLAKVAVRVRWCLCEPHSRAGSNAARVHRRGGSGRTRSRHAGTNISPQGERPHPVGNDW